MSSSTVESAPRTTLIFREVPSTVSEDDVRALLASVVSADSIRSVRPDVNNIVFATLTTEDAATSAAQSLRGKTIGGAPVRVAVKAEQARPKQTVAPVKKVEDAAAPSEDDGWTAVGAKDSTARKTAPREARAPREPREPRVPREPKSNASSAAPKQDVKTVPVKSAAPVAAAVPKKPVAPKVDAFPSLDDLLTAPVTKKGLKQEVARRAVEETKKAQAVAAKAAREERKPRASNRRVDPASVPLPPSVKLSPAPPASFLLPADGYKVRSYSLDKMRSIAGAVLKNLANEPIPEGVQTARKGGVDVVTATDEVRPAFVAGPEPASKWPLVVESPLHGPRRSTRGSRVSETDGMRRSPGLAPLKL